MACSNFADGVPTWESRQEFTCAGSGVCPGRSLRSTLGSRDRARIPCATRECARSANCSGGRCSTSGYNMGGYCWQEASGSRYKNNRNAVSRFPIKYTANGCGHTISGARFMLYIPKTGLTCAGSGVCPGCSLRSTLRIGDGARIPSVTRKCARCAHYANCSGGRCSTSGYNMGGYCWQEAIICSCKS